MTPGGNADGCEKKGVTGKAIRKSMKTKGRQKWIAQRHRDDKETPHPRGDGKYAQGAENGGDIGVTWRT